MHRVAKQIAILIFVVSLALIFSACKGSSSSSGSKDTAVAATVNGKNVMLSEVDQIISQQAKGQQSQLSPLELGSARLQVLDGLIQQQILFQRAQKENLMPTEDEVTQMIQQQKLENRMTDEEYQQMLRESGQTEQSLRETARRTKAIQKLQEKYTGNISISDREVEDAFNNNKQTFVRSRGVGLSAIVVDPRDNGMQDDAKNDTEAKVKIDTIYQRLKSGADFAEVARARSEDPQSGANGGDIGTASEDQLKQNGFPADLIAKLFNPTSMQVGDVTAPVQGSGGRWTIFKLTGRQLQNENLTLDSPGVRDQIKDALINQRRSLLNDALLRVSTAEAKIENKLAQDMLTNPSNLSSLRPAPAPGSAASPSQSPAVSASPAMKATPAAAATGSPAANKNATSTNKK